MLPQLQQPEESISCHLTDNGTSNYAEYAIYSGTRQMMRVVLINSDHLDGNGTRSTQKFGLRRLKAGSITAERLIAPILGRDKTGARIQRLEDNLFRVRQTSLVGELVVEMPIVKLGVFRSF